MILKSYKEICDYIAELEKEKEVLKSQILNVYKNGDSEENFKVSIWERNTYKATEPGIALANKESLLVPDITNLKKFIEIKKLNQKDYLDIASTATCLSIKSF